MSVRARMVIAVVAALVAVAAGAFGWVQYGRAVQEAQAVVPVLPVTAGTPLSRDMFVKKNVPRALVEAGALADADEVEGRIALVDLSPGRVLWPEMLTTPGQFLRHRLPPKMAAVGVKLPAHQVLAGEIHEGMEVRLWWPVSRIRGEGIVTATLPVSSVVPVGEGAVALLGRAYVLLCREVEATPAVRQAGTGTRYGAAAPSPRRSGDYIFVLAVPDDEETIAAVIAAAEEGKIWLTLP